MKEEWLENALAGYQENAKHLFSYPDSTLREYVRDLAHFAQWLAEKGGNQSDGASPSALLLACRREQIEDYIVTLSSRGLQASTINRQIYSLNSFYVWAVYHKLLDVSPLAGVRKLKSRNGFRSSSPSRISKRF